MCKLKNSLFCDVEEIKDILKNRMTDQDTLLAASLKALDTGYHCSVL